MVDRQEKVEEVPRTEESLLKEKAEQPRKEKEQSPRKGKSVKKDKKSPKNEKPHKDKSEKHRKEHDHKWNGDAFFKEKHRMIRRVSEEVVANMIPTVAA